MSADERLSDNPQKKQHHEACERRAESAFDEQALDGARHIRRLVELVTDLNVIGSTDWKRGKLALTAGRPRVSRRPLVWLRDVDRAASIHQRVAGLDVGAVFDRSTSRMKIVCVPCERMGMLFKPLKSRQRS